MKIMKTHLTAAAAALLALATTSASAVVVAPDTIVTLPGTTNAAEPYLGGVVKLDELINFVLDAPAGSGSPITGTVQQRVVQEAGTGYLDFYWRVMVDATSGGSLSSFRIGNFDSAMFDANYRIDGVGTQAPSGIHRFGGTLSSYANFLFQDGSSNPTLDPGESSMFFFLHTTATSFNHSATFDLTTNSSISGQYAAITPGVPEPESYAMMLTGLGLVGAMSRRRRKA